MQKSPGQQLKRTHAHTSTPLQQVLDTQSSIEDLISRIQSTIIQTSESMKQQLDSFEEQQLISYKNDLLKTQDEFIKIRAQRSEDVLKGKILKEKAEVEKKFNTEIKKSMEMNAKYEEMKALVKRLNEEERQLMLEINYVKKKIDLQNRQGLRLDQEIQEFTHKKSTKRGSKIDEERKLFTQLVNKCDQAANKPCKKQEDIIKPNVVENNQKKAEKKLKYEISNLKDYIDNIPLDLNFVQNKLYQQIKSKFEQSKKKPQKEVNDDSQAKDTKENDQDSGEDKENQFDQSTAKEEETKENKIIILPSICKLQGKIFQKNQLKTDYSHLSSPKTSKISKPHQIKSKIVEKQKQAMENQDIPNIEQLPKSSAYLQEILSDPIVKDYLYKILFDGLVEQ